MNDVAVKAATQDIVVDEVFPHAPETIWKVLTSGELIARWMMEPMGFVPVKGNRFSFQTKAAGTWDGTINCEVLEVEPYTHFAYTWQGGDEANIGYGSKLNTFVTWKLSATANGTRLTLVHSGFEPMKNETAYTNLGNGWKICMERIDKIAAGQDVASTH